MKKLPSDNEIIFRKYDLTFQFFFNFFLNISALQFSKALAQLDAVQQKLEISLSNNQKLLNETKAKFADNVERIQKNFETIDQRLTAFKKWSVFILSVLDHAYMFNVVLLNLINALRDHRVFIEIYFWKIKF